jgi:hypothetical protein
MCDEILGPSRKFYMVTPGRGAQPEATLSVRLSHICGEGAFVHERPHKSALRIQALRAV